MKTITFVVAHDSQLKWSRIVADAMREQGWRVEYLAVREYVGFSEAQCRDAGIAPEAIRLLPFDASIAALLDADVVLFPLVGGQTERMLYALREALEISDSGKRPVTAAAYVGVVIDGHVGGLLSRAPADLVFVNSQYDYDLFYSACAALHIPASGLVLSGLGVLPPMQKLPARKEIRTVIFADQVVIPKTPSERRYLYQKLQDYAAQDPSRLLIIKPRHRPGENSLHKKIYSPEQFFRPPLPKNIVLDYRPLGELLPQADLLLTVSSTAALEALAFGVRAAIIADLAIREPYGNHIFLESGLIRTFDQIMANDIGEANKTWLQQYHETEGNAAHRIRDALIEADRRNRREEVPLPQSAYFAARQALYRNDHGFFDFEEKWKRASPPSWVIKAGAFLLPPFIARPLHTLLRRVGLV